MITLALNTAEWRTGNEVRVGGAGVCVCVVKGMSLEYLYSYTLPSSACVAEWRHAAGNVLFRTAHNEKYTGIKVFLGI